MIHILIVEDDDFIREKVVNFVENFTGLKTMESTSGNNAVDILKSRKFSLIISDFHMNDGNGDVILKYLEHSKLHIPVILHTAAVHVEISYQSTTEIRIVEKFDFKALEEAVLRMLLVSVPKT